jgi:hypothetical protein
MGSDMPDPSFKARIRTQRYWSLDGLSEIQAGTAQLLMSGLLLIIVLGDRGSRWHLPLIITVSSLMLACAFVFPRIVNSIRERVTYRLSGYASYGETWLKRRRVLAIALVVFSVGVIALAVRRPVVAGSWLQDQWLPAVVGSLGGIVLGYEGMRQRLPRLFFVGVISLVLGVLLSFMYPMSLAMALYLAGVGCALCGSGGLTLWNYSRTQPDAET